MADRRLLSNECTGSVTGHGRSDVRGVCPWCGRRIDRPALMPDLHSWRTELDAAYRQFYDPDYGTDSLDY